MAEESREPEIKVTDRRRFSSEGEPVEGAAEDGLSESSGAAGAAAASEIRSRPQAPLPPASFEFLVVSLRWQAEMQLGVYGLEGEGEPHRDLEGARHTIDLLAVLQEKSKGNLSWEEQRLLDNTLTELRFRYVQAVDAVKKP